MEGFEKESWLEVELQHPKGWSLAAEAGGFSKGFLRIDSKTAQKLDVKWEKQIVEKKIKPKIQPMLVINNLSRAMLSNLKRRQRYMRRGTQKSAVIMLISRNGGAVQI